MLHSYFLLKVLMPIFLVRPLGLFPTTSSSYTLFTSLSSSSCSSFSLHAFCFAFTTSTIIPIIPPYHPLCGINDCSVCLHACACRVHMIQLYMDVLDWIRGMFSGLWLSILAPCLMHLFHNNLLKLSLCPPLLDMLCLFKTPPVLHLVVGD